MEKTINISPTLKAFQDFLKANPEEINGSLKIELEDIDQKLMNVNEAADFLRVKRSTVMSLKAKNEIPSHRVGGRVVFVKSELMEWVKAN